MRSPARSLVLGVFLLAASVNAQELVVYDDMLQNGWQNFSFGGGSNFDDDDQAHSGTKSISLDGNASFNAVSFARPDVDVTTAQYPAIRFWVHGGAVGGQQLRIYLQLNGGEVAEAELDSFIGGGAIAAGMWREVVVEIGAAPLGYAGSYDRIDIQSDLGEQPILYIDDVSLGQVVIDPATPLTIDKNIEHIGMTSDRFTWRDSAGEPRVAVLAHNDGDVGPDGSRGGALREFQYKLPNGATRVAGLTGYGVGDLGFGYVVMHASRSGCVGTDSPLGGFIPGTSFERVFEGRHHAIFRFRQNYQRNCATTGGLTRTVPVTIDWMFSTGRDNPVWAITVDVDQAAPSPGANIFYDDSRAPYGELAIDGQGFQAIDGVAWGDRFKFTNTTSPLTLNSAWTWNVANTVPYVKEWIAGPLTDNGGTFIRDATMGIVQTQTMTQKDAGGGRDPGVGSDITPFWNKTSAQGNACGVMVFPCPNDWPYQALANSLPAPPGTTNNARMTWKTQYGFIGQTSYAPNDGVVMSASGYPKQSYSTYIVLGTHSSSPVEAQVTEVETIQSVTLSTLIGAVRTTGPAGNTRADNVAYTPAGYNHVYGALAFTAAGNQVDANINVGAGTLKNPVVIVSSYTGDAPVVKAGGVTLTADVDYFASLRPAASEVWVTLNRTFAGAMNRLEILAPALPGVPAIPSGVVATAITATRVDISWNAVAGASMYQVDRKAPGGDFVQIATPVANSHSDMGAAADTAYLYRVRAVGPGGTSASSMADIATTVIFVDDPLAAGTLIKLVHLTQLRTATNAVRTLGGLGPAAFTGGTTVQAIHVTEMRTALDQGRAMFAFPTGGYTDGVLNGVVVKAIHWQELRDRVK